MVLTKLLAAAGLAAAQTSYAIAGQRQCQPLGPGARCRGLNPASSMVDPTIKLLLMSSPKAGATLAVQIVLDVLGKWETAREDARNNFVDMKQPFEHIVHKWGRYGLDRYYRENTKCCGGTDWTCVKLVRDPQQSERNI